MEQNMPLKYATTSNVRYDESMCIVPSDGLSSVFALFKYAGDAVHIFVCDS